MKIERVLSTADRPVADQITWVSSASKITEPDGTVVFEMPAVEVPEGWSQTAVNVIAQKYLRKRGVPERTEHRLSSVDTVEAHIPMWLPPMWLRPSVAATMVTGPETSARQLFHRLAGCWAYHGWLEGLLTSDEDARAFYDEIFMSLARQQAAPNSPQWFNTGLNWAYGIAGASEGHWATPLDLGRGSVPIDAEPAPCPYERPQPSACFIQSVSDDLVNAGGIMDLWHREVRLFKYGSGTGSNFSTLRGKNELLSGGGKSSGLMSFLEVGDRAAGAIKSGGTTRRAAKMVVLNADHPEIEAFVTWKVREEEKAAAISVGSKVIRDRLRAVHATGGHERALWLAQEAGVPEALIDRVVQDAHTDRPFDWQTYELDWECEAVRSVSGQNANNTVRVSNVFMAMVRGIAEGRLDHATAWELYARTTGESVKTITVGGLWDSICRSAWASADPGMQFDNTINEWHTCPADGRINASNPCSEYHFLDDTACNLASIRLGVFLPAGGKFDVAGFRHAVNLWTIVLEISVYMASYPSRAIAERSHLYRTLGLGYADLGGVLMRMGLPYDSTEARSFAASVTALMTAEAYVTSSRMAAVLGPFPAWERNAADMRRVLRNHARACSGSHENYEGLTIKPYIARVDNSDVWRAADEAWRIVTSVEQGFRNAQVTVIAPTGTISYVMDCDTTGIEPDFALVKTKMLAGRGFIKQVNQAVPESLRRLGYSETVIVEIARWLGVHGNIESAPGLHAEHLPVFDCSVAPRGGVRSIEMIAHVKMCAAAQPFLSGASSKTVNLPGSATIDDIALAYLESHRLGLKCVAPYRDGSKINQPLSAGGIEAAADRDAASVDLSSIPAAADVPALLERGVREFLPWRREKVFLQKVKIGADGQSVFLTVSCYPDGRPAEVFIEMAHTGSTLRAFGNVVAMVMSVGLQYGVPVRELVERMRNLRFEPAGIVEGHERIRFASSIPDFVARELGITFLGEEGMAHVQVEGRQEPTAPTAPVGAVGYEPEPCPDCHNFTLVRNGNCLKCDTCGSTTGCS